MQGLFGSIAQYSGIAIFILALTVVGLVGWNLKLQNQATRTKRRFAELLTSNTGQDLESLLIDHTRERLRLQQDVIQLTERIAELESKMRTSKRHFGLTRYDAFDDVGGQQSFAVALFDDAGEGLILSSIVGRTDCRVYCKPIVEGRSERNLSVEEQAAIDSAKRPGVRSVVSP